jgi:hypothetical protein
VYFLDFGVAANAFVYEGLRGFKIDPWDAIGCGIEKNASQRIPTTNCVGYNPTLSARKCNPQELMILRTVKQVRRIFLILAGFTLLALGIVMIFTPGPGTPVILMGLGLLAAEFVWARRIMERIKRETTRLRDAVMGPEK